MPNSVNTIYVCDVIDVRVASVQSEATYFLKIVLGTNAELITASIFAIKICNSVP